MNKKDRMEIIEALERGEISPEDAARRLGQGNPSPRPASSAMEVLEQIERGELNSDEAVELLGAGAAHSYAVDGDYVSVQTVEGPRGSAWGIALGSGIVLTVLSALWMADTLQSSGMNFWFYCAWLPLAIGLLIIVLAWSSRNSPWMQIYVQSDDSDTPEIKMDLPLPMNLIERVMAFAGKRIQRWNGTTIKVDEEIDPDKSHLEIRAGE